MDGYWIVRTYEAGNVGEKTKFFVPGARPTRSQRRLRDAARKQAQNEYSAEKALARLLNANFTEGDLLVGLDYSDEGLARLEAWALRQGLPMETEEERLDTMRAAAEHELQLMIDPAPAAPAGSGRRPGACSPSAGRVASSPRRPGPPTFPRTRPAPPGLPPSDDAPVPSPRCLRPCRR